MSPTSIPISTPPTPTPTTQKPIFKDPALDEIFRRTGYVVTPLLSPEEVQQLVEIHHHYTPDVPNDFFATPFHPDAEYKRQVSRAINPIIQPHVLSLLVGYKLTVSTYVTKRGATTQGKVGMHQDYTFVDQSRCTGVHVWIPLLDVDENNGCMTVYPGTHSLVNHISAMPPQSGPDGPAFVAYPSPYDSVRSVLEQKCGVRVPMEAGVALFFNGRTLHGSEDNRTPGIRIAVGGAYIPEDETMYLYCPNPQDPKTLDIVAVSDSSDLHLAPGKPLPYPYSGVCSQIDSMEYHFDPLTPEQIRPLYHAEARAAEALEQEKELEETKAAAALAQSKIPEPVAVPLPAPEPVVARKSGFAGWLQRIWK